MFKTDARVRVGGTSSMNEFLKAAGIRTHTEGFEDAKNTPMYTDSFRQVFGFK